MRVNTILARSNAAPDEISHRFWNMLLREYEWSVGYRRLLGLFALPAPYGRGKYQHHDGWRS